MAAKLKIDPRRIVALYKLYGARDGVGIRIAKVLGCSPANITKALRPRGYRIYPGKGESAWAL